MTDYSRAPWVDPEFNWKPLPVSEFPERVLIDYATKCNLRCPMCPVWGSEDNNAINSVKGIMNTEASSGCWTRSHRRIRWFNPTCTASHCWCPICVSACAK